MRPFIGWSATVVITLGRSRMGSSCPLLSSPTGNDPAFPKLALLAPTREVLARPSARLSQRACCLKKLFTCQGTPCRRGQTVTGSGTGRAFRLGSPSIYNGHSTIRPKFFSLISLRRLKRPAERAQKTAENFLRQLLRFIKKIRKLNIFRLKKPVLSCIIFK